MSWVLFFCVLISTNVCKIGNSHSCCTRSRTVVYRLLRIPKGFDPTFRFKDIAFTYSDQVNFLPVIEVPLFLSPFFFVSSPFFSPSLLLPFLPPSLSLLSHSFTLGIASSIALVRQEPVLFAMTIREGIMWGSNRDAERFPRRGEIIEAATMANIYKFISLLPEWLQHTLGATRGAGCLVGRNKGLL